MYVHKEWPRIKNYNCIKYLSSDKDSARCCRDYTKKNIWNVFALKLPEKGELTQ